jgi:autotransporter passenger strand-loop-strand repeat protein
LDESAVLAGGTQIVSSGGTASGTVISTGTEIISALGIDSAARLIGGTQLDYGLASGDIVSAGSQVVEAGGTASNTTVSKGILVVSSGGLLSLSGGGIATGATVSAASGGTAAISGLVVDSGYLILSGVTSVAAGATLPTASGGTALLNGAVSNSGTLFASGAYSLVEVLSGATVTGGGSAEVGNGIVEIQNADDDQNVVFLSGGTGGVELDDTLSNPTAYSGTIVGFGSNTHQLIDLVSVKSNSTVKLAYTSASVSSGTLTVSSGGSLVASIALSGGYTSASFHLGAGTGGTVEIIDPPVEVHSANLGLFGQYIAGGFVIAPGSVAGAAVADAWGTGSQELPLAHPHG